MCSAKFAKAINQAKYFPVVLSKIFFAKYVSRLCRRGFSFGNETSQTE